MIVCFTLLLIMHKLIRLFNKYWLAIYILIYEFTHTHCIHVGNPDEIDLDMDDMDQDNENFELKEKAIPDSVFGGVGDTS